MVSEPIAVPPRRSTYTQILKSTMIIGMSSVASIAIGIVRMKAFALLLGPAGVGLIGIYLSIADLAASIAGAGVSGSAVRQVAEAAGNGKQRRAQVVAKVVAILSVVLGLAGGLVLAAAAFPISALSFGTTAHALGVAVLGLAIFLRVVSAGQVALIQGMRRVGDLARMNVFTALAGTIVILPIVYFMHEDGIALAIVVLALLGLAGSWWYSRGLVVPTQVTPERFRRESGLLLKLGVAFLASGLLTVVQGYVIRILVLHDGGASAAGLYQAAWAIGGFYASFVLQAMGMDFYPRLTAAQHDHEECNRLVNEQTQVGLLIAGPGVLATLTLAPLVMLVFYSSEFQEAAPILRWICLGVMLRVISWPMGFVMLAKGAQRAFLFSEIAATAVHIGLAALLVPWLGVEGAGLAFFGLYVVHTALVMFIAHRLTGFRWTGQNARMIALLAAVALLVKLAFLVLPFWLATALGSAATCVIGFGALVMLVRLVPMETLPAPLRALARRLASTGSR